MGRAIGVYPSEDQLNNEFLPLLIDSKNEGFVAYKVFEAQILRILASNECAPSSADVLMQAFRSIDTENTGMISAELLEELMVSKGSSFRPKELEVFMEAVKDPEGNIYYEDYVALCFRGK